MTRSITDTQLDAFCAWVTRRGRSEDTAELYRKNLRRCSSDPGGLTHRVTSRALAPNTRRTNLAALAAWAKFSEDTSLIKQLAEIRLPPARRVTPKVPLPEASWRALIAHLETCNSGLRRCPALRPIHLLIAMRGIRVGDVIRMTRPDLERALKTGKLSFTAKGEKRLEWSAKPLVGPIEELLAVPTPMNRPWTTVGELVGDGTTKTRIHRVRRALFRHADHDGLDDLGLDHLPPHRLRRTYATEFLRELAGDPQAPVKLQRHMGWSNLNTAMSYVDAVDTDELDQVAERLAQRMR